MYPNRIFGTQQVGLEWIRHRVTLTAGWAIILRYDVIESKYFNFSVIL